MLRVAASRIVKVHKTFLEFRTTAVGWSNPCPSKQSLHTINPSERAREDLSKDRVKGKISFTRPSGSFKDQLSGNGLWTVPNMLTMSRIGITPAIGYFIWTGMYSQALSCFVFAALTDALDGLIARRFNQRSEIGAILDPIADKLLLTTCFVSLYNVGLMPIWLVKGFIARDLIIVTGGFIIRYYGFSEPPTLRKFLDFEKHPTLGMEPNFTSKCNTALQCLLIVLHLGTDHLVGLPTYDRTLSGLQILTAITSCASLTQYVIRIQIPRFTARPPPIKGK